MTIVAALALAILIVAANVFVAVPRDVAFRALDPASPACDPASPGWTVLSEEGNSETQALEARPDIDWKRRFHCAIQQHRIPGYFAKARPGRTFDLAYTLAFLEFQENGSPYLLCSDADYDANRCDGVTFEPTPGLVERHRSQLDALLDYLGGAGDKNYVIVFIHGWRNTADIGNGNVADLRIYAAHAARYILDRCQYGDSRFCGMKVTAIYVGWRGARTDEARLRAFGRWLGGSRCHANGCAISAPFERWASLGAILTLFDRKPISEAIAPSVVSALRAVESRIGLQQARRQTDLAPCEYWSPAKGARGCTTSGDNAAGPQARMIVFGHSLGGNLLATGLEDAVVKQVEKHRPGEFLPPPLGNLVVLINPASEAAKWTAIQRAIWDRVARSADDKRRDKDLLEDRDFFRLEQRPVMVSVTSARDWPPGGLRPSDCAELLKLVREARPNAETRDILKEMAKDIRRRAGAVEYDQATFDAFPAFRFDFRPLASSLERAAQSLSDWRPAADGPLTGQDVVNACAGGAPRTWRGWLSPHAWEGAALRGIAGVLRTLPFMDTNIEQTHAIGHLDPDRNAQSLHSLQSISPRPFGTTHQLLGWEAGSRPAAFDDKLARVKGYLAARDRESACPSARDWLSKALAVQWRFYHRYDGWDAADVAQNAPALRFEHGYYPAHIYPITLGADPFWNMRVLDDVLARHDGFLRANFICGLQQLVLDDVTRTDQPQPPSGFEAPPSP
ncbi:MAG: hypothetical protein KGM15_05335 [Pseudomonadota bacterium]|nr:hypothetical protein [Pseudomonadota bacterium]